MQAVTKHKHSPGPWSVDIEHNQEIKCSYCDNWVWIGDSFSIYRIVKKITVIRKNPTTHRKKLNPSPSNARLISVAPDMYDLLKECIDVGPGPTGPLRMKFEAILKKAEGK